MLTPRAAPPTQVRFDGDSVAYGARTPEARLPVEVWPRSDDCPVPTVNDTASAELTSHAIDTVFYTTLLFEEKVPPPALFLVICFFSLWRCNV